MKTGYIMFEVCGECAAAQFCGLRSLLCFSPRQAPCACHCKVRRKSIDTTSLVVVVVVVIAVAVVNASAFFFQ